MNHGFEAQQKALTPSLRWTHILALWLIILGARLLTVGAFGTTTPYWDDWGVGGLLLRHAENGFTLADIFRTANEHRFIFSKLLNIALFELNSQQWDTRLVQVANAVLASGVAALLLYICSQCQTQINALLAAFFVLLFWAAPVSLLSQLWAMQTHTYFMILLVVAGIWFAHARTWSAPWWLAMFCLLAAPHTLLGGVFAALSVCAVFSLHCVLNQPARKPALATILVSAVAAAIGLLSMLLQRHPATERRPETLVDALTAFMKTLSWPLNTEVWPALLLMLPCLLLLWAVLSGHRRLDRVASFTLALFFFALGLAAATAYSRGLDGAGPARRHLEFLTLGALANIFALCLVQRQKQGIADRLKAFSLLAWIAVFLAALPYQWEVYKFTLADRERLNTRQFFNVRNYLVDGNYGHLLNKRHREVPFSSPRNLKHFLDRAAERDMMQYDFQVPALPKNLAEQSTFVANGTYAPGMPDEILTYNSEAVIGSYNRELGGRAATGRFVSATMKSRRPFPMIPITGHLGLEGQTLSLQPVDGGAAIAVRPRTADASLAQSWRPIWIATPDAEFRILAVDASADHWFGFGMPRTVGSLSYYSMQLTRKADGLIKMGALLLLISLLPMLRGLFTVRSEPTPQ